MKLKKVIFIVVLLVSIFSSCTTKNEEIIVDAGTYEFGYYNIIDGNHITYNKEVEKSPLTFILNDWISDLAEQNVSYGNSHSGGSILEELKVEASYLKKDTIIIVINEAFLYFDNGYSRPVYFINGLRDILKEVTDASKFSIQVEGYTSSIIHPDGVSIKNITITSSEN